MPGDGVFGAKGRIHPMENALLVGLSRQMSLGNELDMIANNIANIDTTGFKADNTVFSEFLMPGASDQNFNGRDRRVSFVQDRTTFIDMAPGALQNTGSPLDIAIDGNAYFTVQTARGQRYTRNGAFQVNAAGQLVTSNGDQVLGANGPIVFQNTDHDIVISASGIITVREGNSTIDSQRGTLQLASFANPQSLQKDGASTFMPPPGVAPAPAPDNTRVVQGMIEKSNVNGVVEMARMIRITRSYTDVANILSQEGDLRKNALQQLSQAPASS
jgi:flagellar basal-body rod protein FlgF